MSTADLLVEQMFFWMEEREECADNLEKLARELESLRGNCNVFQAAGSSVTVVGSAFLIGAGLATAFTGGEDTLFLGLVGGLCTGAGVSVSLITKLTEHFMERDIMNNHEITKRIQRLSKQLKEECEKASSFTDPDDLDLYIMTEIVGAIAKRSELNPRFINHSIRRHFSHGDPGAIDVHMTLIQPALLVGLAVVLTAFSLEASGKESSVLKGGAIAVGGAIGMAFPLSEAINQWKDLINDNHVTEASQFLRDTADTLRQLKRALRA